MDSIFGCSRVSRNCVAECHDRLRADCDAPEYIDDTTVTTRVKAALVKEPAIKSNAIEVETYRGVVSLSGFVDSPDIASKAVSTANPWAG